MKIFIFILFLVSLCFSNKPQCEDTINTSLSITDSLKNVWPLNNNLCDLKSSNNLTIVGSGTFSDSGFNNKRTGYLKLDDTIISPTGYSFSISFRCKLDSVGLGSKIDLVCGSENTGSQAMFYTPTGNEILRIRDTLYYTNDDEFNISSGIILTNYNTYTLVFKSADSLQLFVNGVFYQNRGWHGWIHGWVISQISGGYNPSDNFNMRGTLMYFMYFKRALTRSEVDTLYKNPFYFSSTTPSTNSYSNGKKRIGLGVLTLNMALDSLQDLTGNCSLEIVKKIIPIRNTLNKTLNLNGYNLYIYDSIAFNGYENRGNKIIFNENNSIGLFDFTFNNGKVFISGLNISDLNNTVNAFNAIKLSGNASYTIKNTYLTMRNKTGLDTGFNFKTSGHDSMYNVIVDSAGVAISTIQGSKLHASNNFIVDCGVGFNIGDTAFLYNNVTAGCLNNKSFVGLLKSKGYSNACDDSSCGNNRGWDIKDTNYEKVNTFDAFGNFKRNNYYYLMTNTCPDRCLYSMSGGRKSDIGQNIKDIVGNPRGWAVDTFSIGVKEYVSRPQTRSKIRIGLGTNITKFEYGIDSLFNQTTNCTLLIVGRLDTITDFRYSANNLNGKRLYILDTIKWAHPIISNTRLMFEAGGRNNGHIFIDGLDITNVYEPTDILGLLVAGYDTVTIRNCKLRSTYYGKIRGCFGIAFENHNLPSFVYNNIINDCYYGILAVNKNDFGVYAENNIMYNCVYGIRGSTYGHVIFKNNIIYGNNIDMATDAKDLDGYNNACSDTSCGDANWRSGSGNLTNVVVYDEFIDTNITSYNFGYLKSNSRLKFVGTTTSSENNKDITGYDRPFRFKYSIGIKEYTTLDTLYGNLVNWSRGRIPSITDTVIIDSFTVAPDTIRNYWLSNKNIYFDTNASMYSLYAKRSFSKNINLNGKTIKTAKKQIYNHNGNLTIDGNDTLSDTLCITNTGFKKCSSSIIIPNGNTTFKTNKVKFNRIRFINGMMYYIHARDTLLMKSETVADLNGTASNSKCTFRSDTTGMRYYFNAGSKLSPRYTDIRDMYVITDSLYVTDTTNRNSGNNSGKIKQWGNITNITIGN